MKDGRRNWWRRILPWAISIAALVYVFGFVTDWSALVTAMQGADVPLFVGIVVIDKVAFFVAWGLLQALAVRRFVGAVPYSQVIAIRGGSELLRAANGNIADAAIVLGLMQITRASVVSILAASTLPYLGHILVMLVQATLAAPLLAGGIAANRDVAVAVAAGWALTAGGFVLIRLAPSLGVLARSPVGSWLSKIDTRVLLPYFSWFLLLAVVDIGFQWFATRAFGIPIPWEALAARIPILYVVLAVPSLGGFGPRELTWAYLFAEYASRDALIAYAFATNAIFLALHIVIGAIFLPRALELIDRIRRARASGETLPEPLLHDPVDP